MKILRLLRFGTGALALSAFLACADQSGIPGDETTGAPESPGEVAPGPAEPVGSLTLEPVDVGTEALLQAVGTPSPEVIWLSGHEGTWARSVDGGTTWESGVVEGYEEFQFRDVEAFDGSTALLMSAGPGDASRILRTGDGGRGWEEVFRMDHPEGFLDCMDFWDRDRGLVYGDAVDGEFYVLTTGDGGRSWRRIPPDVLPPALEGEGGFAASGSCVDTAEPGLAWIVTGNGSVPRLVRTGDAGESWSVSPLPLAEGSGRGATTVGFRPDGLGFALGGDLDPDGGGARVALTADRGASWSAVGDLVMDGAVYGAAWIPDRDPATVVAVGPGGLDFSVDGGMRWLSADTAAYWAVGFSTPDRGWAVGPGGRVTRVTVRP
jgi:photosystem II stability/assembly factor-like uncharacterized protein